jgi:hypothetical protein
MLWEYSHPGQGSLPLALLFSAMENVSELLHSFIDIS